MTEISSCPSASSHGQDSVVLHIAFYSCFSVLGSHFQVVRHDSAHLCAFFINAEVVIEVQVSDEAFSTALKYEWLFINRCRGYVSLC